MRHATAPLPLPAAQPQDRHDWNTIKTLIPYLWTWKWRVIIALSCLILAKVANVAVPLVFKHLIDALSIPHEQMWLAVPVGLLAAYGLLRFSNSLFTEFRELVFARVTQRAVRTIALQVFEHLHGLSLRFHLNRQTGGLTRDIERGTRSINSLISYSLYSILPTIIEVLMVLGILLVRYDKVFALITFCALTAYILFTVLVSNRRMAQRRAVNELDSVANSRAIDSLLNYETVKYFNNEQWEKRRYDVQLQKL